MIPKKRARPKMGLKQSTVLRVPQFLKHVRQHECACSYHLHSALDCQGPIEAAHVRTGTDGGTGMKPSDRYSIPLCSWHHRRQHQIGEALFEKETGINMRGYADLLWLSWLKTDTGRRWALKTEYSIPRETNNG